jgi:probable F420-dependent oxidoreductase
VTFTTLLKLPGMSINRDRRVRIGLQIRPQDGDYSAIRRAAAEAEDLGVDILFNWDHFFPLGKEREGKHFECWTMLGAWAESTSRVEIGALVTCNSYRNPDLLADMARTVDHISKGRLILGIGAGFKEREYLEYGYEFGTVGSRLNALADSVERIERRFAMLNPPPMRRIPMLIGGGGEQKTLRLVARHADIWHTFSEGEELAHKTAILERYCAELERNPDDIERSTFVDGTPHGRGDALRALGITLFVIGSGGPDYDLSELRDWIAWRDTQN